MTPSAATRVAGVIGDPISHSLSPAIHNAAFAATELDWTFVAFPVRAGQASAAVRAVAVLGLGGLSVTMPHKESAAEACDELVGPAGILGAVNTVVPRADGLEGHSTDGEGFRRAVADEGVALDGAEVLVLGAGGAARAIVHALGTAGATVTVAARRLDAARVAAALAPGAEATRLEARDVLEDRVAASGVIVNATSLGMRGEDPPFDPTALHEGQLVFDAIYAPRKTPLLDAAKARGARTLGGLSMLVHQGALAFELWTGRPAPLDVMRAAADGGSGLGDR